ncbi:All-trans-phytoene synthase [Planctomycetes bacterium Pan216]|uniref:All-trans-phytoene synthase n=1 Tax=Kolteria novifilia TaxID=2527975 RepID=A0A518B9S8_9BACT|nr:All-trans-phytoene synthase [Planctomycetes bacterium Pan216]
MSIGQPRLVSTPNACGPCGTSSSLAASYADCQRLAKRSARNFYYSFLVLPKPQRLSMCALYAFLRKTDDLGDSEESVESKRAKLQHWRFQFDKAMAGEIPEICWWRAFVDTVQKYQIPRAYFDHVIDGVMDDLVKTRYASFGELYQYCYKVASVVGLSCLRIWGATDEEAALPAEWCGIAFQLTNVLRDVVEDKQRDRVYLPQDELIRFGVAEEELEGPRASEAFVEMMRFQVARAEDYYARSEVLFDHLPGDAHAVLRVMRDVYHGLLGKIARDPSQVLSRRVSLSPARKIAIVARGMSSQWLTRSS